MVPTSHMTEGEELQVAATATKLLGFLLLRSDEPPFTYSASVADYRDVLLDMEAILEHNQAEVDNPSDGVNAELYAVVLMDNNRLDLALLQAIRDENPWYLETLGVDFT